MSSKEVVEKKNTEMAMASFEEDSGVGMEDMGQDDTILPRIKLLQKMSGEVDEDDSHYVEGAKVGMFLNQGTGTLSDTLEVIPVYYRRSAVEWTPRDSGGGFVAEHSPDILNTLERDDRGKFIQGENLVEDTRNWYFLVIKEDGTVEPGVMSMTSTAIKASRELATKARNLKLMGKNGPFNPPLFSQRYEISSITKSNDEGSWKTPVIKHLGSVESPDIYTEAKSAHDSFQAMSVDYGQSSNETDSNTEDEDF